MCRCILCGPSPATVPRHSTGRRISSSTSPQTLPRGRSPSHRTDLPLCPLLSCLGRRRRGAVRRDVHQRRRLRRVRALRSTPSLPLRRPNHPDPASSSTPAAAQLKFAKHRICPGQGSHPRIWPGKIIFFIVSVVCFVDPFPTGVTDLSNADGQVCCGGEAASLVGNAGWGATSGWTRRIRIGKAPGEREMNPDRKTSLQLSVRAYAEKGDGPVVKTAPKCINRGVVALLDTTRTVFYALP